MTVKRRRVYMPGSAMYRPDGTVDNDAVHTLIAALLGDDEFAIRDRHRWLAHRKRRQAELAKWRAENGIEGTGSQAARLALQELWSLPAEQLNLFNEPVDPPHVVESRRRARHRVATRLGSGR